MVSFVVSAEICHVLDCVLEIKVTVSFVSILHPIISPLQLNPSLIPKAKSYSALGWVLQEG